MQKIPTEMQNKKRAITYRIFLASDLQTNLRCAHGRHRHGHDRQIVHGRLHSLSAHTRYLRTQHSGRQSIHRMHTQKGQHGLSASVVDEALEAEGFARVEHGLLRWTRGLLRPVSRIVDCLQSAWSERDTHMSPDQPCDTKQLQRLVAAAQSVQLEHWEQGSRGHWALADVYMASRLGWQQVWAHRGEQ